jgi:multicopper oxidase
MVQRFDRRSFLRLTGGGLASLALASCSQGGTDRVAAGGSEVQANERRRRRGDAPVRDILLSPGPASIDLGGMMVETIAYDGVVPGREVRVRAGEVLRARVTNRLSESTTIHWHGLALRNDMDGVPGLTQSPISSGASFTYEFVVPDPGTYWFHPHFGLQLDAGLYAPLIVEDPAEPGRYDREVTIVLDDWMSGLGPSPEETMRVLRDGGMPMGGGMQMGAGTQMGGSGAMPMANSPQLGGDAGDVSYPSFLLNGRRADTPQTIEVRRGERIRMRILNAGSDTAFRVALGGHRLTVTHTDGFPVEPVTVDALLVGMSERYDVTVTVAGDGAFPLVGMAEGKNAQAMAVLRSGSGAAPSASAHPAELDGRLLQLSDLRADKAVSLNPKAPDRVHRVALGAAKEGYRWLINGRAVDAEADVLKDARILEVREGQRVRLEFDNQTTMFHPMHLHGHTFQVVSPEGVVGPRKDSMIVRPNERISVDFDANNPGQWLIHCHNLYHQNAGMHSVVSYVR